VASLPILLAAYVAAAGLLTITPGPDTALVLRSATVSGPRSGAAAGFGICLGLIAWSASAALGLTALLAASPLAFGVLKWAGAAYLVYLGIALLRRPQGRPRDPDADAKLAPVRADLATSFRDGLLSNLPKVGVFYVTFLPQFTPADRAGPAFVFALAAIHVALTLAWFVVLVSMSVPLRRFLSLPRIVSTLDRATGCVFVAFGIRLALTER
jgi:threonine/homoserine/homoserine lactone efflux protein